jgi:exodeoxyribonuclease VII large subunit
MLELARRGLPDPRKRLEDLQLRNDDLVERIRQLTIQGLQKGHEGCVHLEEKLCYRSPLEQVVRSRSHLEHQGQSLLLWIQWKLERCVKALEKAMAELDATSPLNILKRGYSITRTWPEKNVVIDAKTLDIQQVLNVKLYQGELICRVEEIGGDSKAV